MKLILFGAPGAGKGTQAESISKEFCIPAISTGNILREAIQNKTPIGLEAKRFMDNGQLVPDSVVIGIVEERVGREDCKNGYILDGVPRTLAQAEELERFGVAIDKVVSIEIEDSVIEKRMSGRRVCSHCGASYHITENPPKIEGVCGECGGALIIRPDDKSETVRERLAVYHRMTEPIKGFYEARGKLVSVDGNQPIRAVHKAILEALGKSV
ncbi:MAG: adenylate kinase [Oscillospiraceae bacterium]|nr:adenylate kinase [Oscillospiraceae bacterium]